MVFLIPYNLATMPNYFIKVYSFYQIFLIQKSISGHTYIYLFRIQPGDNPVAFTSAQSHYSIKRAAMMAGMGFDSVVDIKCNINGDMIPEELDLAITRAK